jgi:ATP-binding cassette subfamily B protein/subfamily B ATP-binding cassette protein MsbA
MWTMKHFNPKMREGNQKVMNDYNHTSNVLQETLTGVGIFKHFRKERYASLRFSQALHELIKSQMYMVRIRIINSQILSYVYALAPTVLIVFGGSKVIQGTMTMGAFVAFYSYLGRMYGPVRSLANLNVELQQTLVAFYRFYDLLHTVSDEDDNAVKADLPAVTRKVEMKNVTFAYNETQEKIMEDFSLTMEPGQMIGIVGRNGIGKSTLFGLISGHYQPEKGEILLDGIPVRRINKSSLQKMFGVVPQDSYLFNVNLLDNITLGRRHLALERVDELAEMLNIKGFVENLPDGWNTMAEKNGENFSGGQRQKFGIIRALANDPQILFLDEATSAIDVETEEAFFEWLSRNKGDKIILYISHKPHLLKYADRIMRFEGYNEIAVEESCELIS